MSSSQHTDEKLAEPPSARPDGARWRGRFSLLGGSAAVAAIVAAILLLRVGSSEVASGARIPTSLATVTEQTLTSHLIVDGVLGYTGAYRVMNHLIGIVTALPEAGDTVMPGGELYSVNGVPVLLLEGAMPAYRPLSEGMRGVDVAQLNAALVALGYADASEIDPISDEFTEATAAAVMRLQADLGMEETGSLQLGHVVFLPGPARVSSIETSLASPVQVGATVLRATSTTPIVSIALATSHQSRIEIGDAVIVTLPDRRTTEGTVTSIGSVAQAGGGSGGGGGASGPTIAVEVELHDSAVAGRLDQAPVSVSITTAVMENATVVPVTALVALPGGGHGVEVQRVDGTREIVPVTTGLFDESRGLVAISGEGIQAGLQVVVPGR